LSQQPVPGTRFTFAKHGAGNSGVPYLALHPMGFAMPRRLRFERWSLTPPFHPYRSSCELRRYILCGTFRRDASRRHLPRVSPTESELRGIAPCGVRTFLLRIAPEAILRPSKTGEILPQRQKDTRDFKLILYLENENRIQGFGGGPGGGTIGTCPVYVSVR
jgi:hypothetical protein